MHLEEIAIHVAPGAHAVLLLDQAGWHGSAELVVPPNITLMPIPPRCPELNPVENVWQFMRDNWLSNRIFKSYDDIVDHCCFAWNKLVDQPWRIMSIGLRQWAHGVTVRLLPRCLGLEARGEVRVIDEVGKKVVPSLDCEARIAEQVAQLIDAMIS